MSDDCRAVVRQSSLFKEDSYHSSKPHCSLCIRPNPGILRRFVAELEEIPDGCAELFPFEVIDELRSEYL